MDGDGRTGCNRYNIKIYKMTKNIITNILGLGFIVSSVYGLLKMDLELTSFFALVGIGCVLFYFENKSIKTFIRKGVNKYLKND